MSMLYHILYFKTKRINLKILGIDPGYAIIGYSLLDCEYSKLFLEKCGVIETSSNLSFPDRLNKIFDEISLIINEFSPSCASIESLYFQNNQKTAMYVSQARGVILLAMKKLGIEIFEYTPLQVKTSLTGFGRATKKQMILSTQRLLNMKTPAKPDDAADAIALAICHYNVYKFKNIIRGRT